MMPGRKNGTGAGNRHNLNNIPIENDEWGRMKDWCAKNDMTMGEMGAMAIRQFMRRRKI